MRSDVTVGTAFPDYRLPDHTGKPRRLSEIQAGDPMIIVLARQAYSAKDQWQHAGLARLWREMKPGVGYCQMVTITTSDPQETLNYRSGVAAEWPFLADPGRSVQRDLDIAEYTDPAHNQMVPHTIVCEPGLIIYKIYNGYWFFGRPTVEELRMDLRAVLMKCRWDWDLSAPEVRAAWQRGEISRFYPQNSAGPLRSRLAAPAHDEEHVMARPHARAWFSEFAGTTILLFASVLVTRWLFGPHSALASAVPGMPGRMAIDGAVIGAVIGLLIISPFGRSSGGHFNPAVTVTLWLLRGLPGRDATAYIAAQLAGSLTGVLLARAALGAVISDPAVDYAAIQPAAGWVGGAVFTGEAISLAVLMAVVVAFLDRSARMRWTPAVVATGVAVLIFAGGLTSGGSFNPARQLGPLLFAARFTYLWAYMLGPLAGAVILAALVQVLGLPQPLTCSLCGVPPRDAAPTPVPLRSTERHGADHPACRGLKRRKAVPPRVAVKRY